jgi:hypothetical protein
MILKKYSFNWALGILPIVSILIGRLIFAQMFPIYSGVLEYDTDPAYGYLFNGLLMLDGQAPFQVDHPGTPLQLLCAAVTGLKWLFDTVVMSKSGGVIDSVLLNPESYILTISSTLVLLNAAATFFLGSSVYKATANLPLSLFSQCSIFLFGVVTLRTGYLAPEALLIFASLCLLGHLAPSIFVSPETNQENLSNVFGCGVACGFGLAVKLNFLPIVLLLLVLPTFKQLSRAIVWMAASWVIFVIPIWKHLPRMFDWITAIVTHAGVHGSGSRQLFDIPMMHFNLATQYRDFPALFIVLCCLLMWSTYCVIKWLLPLSTNTHGLGDLFRTIRVPLVMCLTGVAQIAMILKHPGYHYMVPVLPAITVAIAWLIFALIGSISEAKKAMISALLLVGGLLVSYQSVAGVVNRLTTSRSDQNLATNSIDKILRQYQDPIIIGAYRSTIAQYALAYAVTYAPGLEPKIGKYFTNFYEWNHTGRELVKHGQGVIPTQLITQWIQEGKVIFLVSPTYYADFATLSISPVYIGSLQSLYRVWGLPEGDKK